MERTAVRGELQTDVVRDLEGFDALAADWAQLYADCPPATPFQSHAWLAAWARAYGVGDQLRVVVVRSAGRLVAAAPLVRTRRGPWAVLAPLGGDITDVVDVLVREPVEPGVDAALTAALLAESGWRVIDLPEVAPAGGVLRWSRTWPGRSTTVAASRCLELPAVPLPEQLDRLPGRTASTLRRKLRKVDQLGVQVTGTPAADVPAGVAALLALHEEQWRGRGGNPEHLTPRFTQHLTEALTRLVADGQARLAQYRIDGELVAAQIDLLGHDTLSYYLAGVSPRLRELADVSSMLVRHDLEQAVAAGLPRYSMLRGLEDYKYRWRPDPVQQHRVVLSRPGLLAGAGYPLLVRA
ncbi:MAG: Acetyltransferase involved in cellulose biosynthesis, CelD/BcsL family, partial [Modestobacter sp.]|nr:Acetyltransferase involved in cellulose biosynthesis, CelD/BcsL family [Modestobacter sp.]